MTAWRRGSWIAVSFVLSAGLAVLLGACGPQTAGSASPSQAASQRPTATFMSPTSRIPAQPVPSVDPNPPSSDAPSLPAIDPTSGLAFVEAADLPPEALETLRLIDEDGPFPFDRDGLTFQNREELLPDDPAAYYREYTVVTPGLSHRGARRIVAGKGGERYYTADHYESFGRIRLSGNDP